MPWLRAQALQWHWPGEQNQTALRRGLYNLEPVSHLAAFSLVPSL